MIYVVNEDSVVLKLTTFCTFCAFISGLNIMTLSCNNKN